MAFRYRDNLLFFTNRGPSHQTTQHTFHLLSQLEIFYGLPFTVEQHATDHLKALGVWIGITPHHTPWFLCHPSPVRCQPLYSRYNTLKALGSVKGQIFRLLWFSSLLHPCLFYLNCYLAWVWKNNGTFFQVQQLWHWSLNKAVELDRIQPQQQSSLHSIWCDPHKTLKVREPRIPPELWDLFEV
eukprot:TRINITY_DN66606_c5_g3_i2.p1 TRINITY_DN66606_c5_g3~~TRINITY_DN66606_c5_g3_i2.p1  ORF type:complete len:184 (+),score=7.34 TRINITY_DN66606_c5_g3_i2:60-611(+)